MSEYFAQGDVNECGVVTRDVKAIAGDAGVYVCVCVHARENLFSPKHRVIAGFIAVDISPLGRSVIASQHQHQHISQTSGSKFRRRVGNCACV